jgi:hypothetical protein
MNRTFGSAIPKSGLQHTGKTAETNQRSKMSVKTRAFLQVQQQSPL